MQQTLRKTVLIREALWQSLHWTRTSQLVAECTCHEGQRDGRTLLHLGYLLSQE